MKPLFAFFFSLQLIAGFTQTKQKDITRSGYSFLQANNLPVSLSYFDQKIIPDSLYGCSEAYAFDTLMLRAHKMILFTDLGSIAIMKINYQLIFFKIDHSEIHGKQILYTFSGKGYTVKFTSKEIKKVADEFFIRTGTIEVFKNGQKKIFYVTGNYGC